jgi:hypothetical protein
MSNFDADLTSLLWDQATVPPKLELRMHCTKTLRTAARRVERGRRMPGSRRSW